MHVTVSAYDARTASNGRTDVRTKGGAPSFRLLRRVVLHNGAVAATRSGVRLTTRKASS